MTSWVARGMPVVAFALAASAAGCGVPDVTFVSDAASPPRDGSLEAADVDSSGGSPDGATDGPPDVASEAATNTCPGTVPPGATTCCSAIACSGCATTDCPMCESRCTLTEICCVRSLSVSCHTGACP